MTIPKIAFLAVAAGLMTTPARAASPAPRPSASAHPSVSKAAGTFAELERQEIAKLSAELDALVADVDLLAPFKARDREKLLSRTQKRFEKLRAEKGITHWYFLDPEPARTCFLRVHSPTLFGDVVGRETLTRAIATHEIGSGKELGKTAFALRVVKPIRVDGAIIGYMELGEEIGDFLGRMKGLTGDDFALLVDKQRLDRKELARVRGEDRWDERPDVVLIDSTVWNERLVQLPVPFDKLPEGGVGAGDWTEGNRRFVGGAFPVKDAANRSVGTLFVRHPL